MLISMWLCEHLSLGDCIRAMSLSNDPNNHLGLVNLVQLAKTEEEKNDAIIRWIKSQVDHHPDYILYLHSKTKRQTVPKVLNQYKIVSRMLGLLSGLMTPVDHDEAPSCKVKMVRSNLRSTCTR